MTSATVTYHELPPLTSWASDSESSHCSTSKTRTEPSHITNASPPAVSQQQQQQIICSQVTNQYRSGSGTEFERCEGLWTSNSFISSTQFHQIHTASPTTTSQQQEAANGERDYRTKKRATGNQGILIPTPAIPSSSGIAGHALTEELCLVCGDKASGYHYNALTCEGCKGFFRRSVTRKAVYHCKYGESCDIDMYMRRKCQHCRLKKCMEIGMRPERLRADTRVPLVVIPEDQCRIKREAKQKQRQRSVAAEQHNAGESPQAVTSTESPPECTLSVETRELINRTVAIDTQFAAPANDSLMKISECYDVGGSYQQLAELTILSLQLIHHFTMHLPGFCKLSDEDRRILHKGCKTEVLVLRTARCYDSNDEQIVLGNNSKQWRYKREQYRVFIGPLADSIFDFAHSIAKMRLDQAEFVLLMAIAIFTDRPGLLQPKAVEDIQEVYISALQSYIETKRPKQQTLFARIVLKLAELRSFTSEQTEFFSEIKSNKNTQQSPRQQVDIKYTRPKHQQCPTYPQATNQPSSAVDYR